MVWVTDGWFDDPIGLSARAYILVPPIALDKSLLVRPYLIPWIKLLPDPQAYTSSPHWPLLSITQPHSHAPLRHINVPAQHAYASPLDWSPQSRCCLIPVLFLLWSYDILTNFDAFVVFIDPLSYGPLIRWPDHLPYSFPRTKASAGLRIGPFAYSEDNNRQISQWPHFPISSTFDSRCTPQFCYLGNSSTLLILVVLRSS